MKQADIPEDVQMMYDVRGVFESGVTEGDLESLRELFASDGWRVLMNKKAEQAEKAAGRATDPSVSDRQAFYYKCRLEGYRADIMLPYQLEDAIRDCGEPQQADDFSDDSETNKPWSLMRFLGLR